MKNNISEILDIHLSASMAMQPIKPGEKNDYFYGERIVEVDEMPEYYLLYLLLAELLGYPCLGKQEKVGWSIPLQYKEQIYIVEFRKSGIGLFCKSDEKNIDQARQIVDLLKKGIRAARPYFDCVAESAVKSSKINIYNKSSLLYERYQYFLNEYNSKSEEIKKMQKEILEKTQRGERYYSPYLDPCFELKRNSKWLALAAIDCFFSWTEHVFIHLAVLMGYITQAEEVANLSKKTWVEKFKVALDMDVKEIKTIYDDLIIIREQLRNFMAHGAFGKRGEAFTFHSKTGAIPVRINHSENNSKYSIIGGLEFDEHSAIETINDFIDMLWKKDREPAYYYIQESDLPTILTLAEDGTYKKAMQSNTSMNELIEYLHYQFDRAANMDW